MEIYSFNQPTFWGLEGWGALRIFLGAAPWKIGSGTRRMVHSYCQPHYQRHWKLLRWELDHFSCIFLESKCIKKKNDTLQETDISHLRKRNIIFKHKLFGEWFSCFGPSFLGGWLDRDKLGIAFFPWWWVPCVFVGPKNASKKDSTWNFPMFFSPRSTQTVVKKKCGVQGHNRNWWPY